MCSCSMSSPSPSGWSSSQGWKMTRQSVSSSLASSSSSSSSSLPPSAKSFDIPPHCMARNSVKNLQNLHHSLSKSLSACTTWAAEGNTGFIAAEMASMRPQLTESFTKIQGEIEGVLRASKNLHDRNVILAKQVADLKAKLESANAEIQQTREAQEDEQLTQMASIAEQKVIDFSEASELVEDTEQTAEKETDVIPSSIQ